MSLKTNWKDDILDVSMGGKRRYREIENDNGTVSLVDDTTYQQIGDNFGASDLNEICGEINEISTNLTQFYVKAKPFDFHWQQATIAGNGYTVSNVKQLMGLDASNEVLGVCFSEIRGNQAWNYNQTVVYEEVSDTFSFVATSSNSSLLRFKGVAFYV